MKNFSYKSHIISIISPFKEKLIFIGLVLCLSSCTNSSDPKLTKNSSDNFDFYKGADLSYVNEMEDCGAIFKNSEGIKQDPYSIFYDAGCNLVRLRLWHNPDWTNYSNFEDVKKGIKRAKAMNMKVLLDFHYSDFWADPQKQQIPGAWLGVIDNTSVLGDSIYNYTLNTLKNLHALNLTPEMVQVGNEINPMILQEGELVWPIDWERNAFLINKGIQAVRDFSSQNKTTIEIMLHIAQPENALTWFEEATANGITDYDWIGISYYPKWSTYELKNLGSAIKTLINTYKKDFMVVETAYPYTLDNIDDAGNILGSDALIPGFPATEEGQLNYLNTLSKIIYESGGKGIVYWEPAWVSNNCSTLWGKGSHWDNATLFDHQNTANLGMQFYSQSTKD